MSIRPISIIIVSILIAALLAAVFVFLKKPAQKAVAQEFTVPNGSVERSAGQPQKPVSWVSERWGDNTTTFSYLSTGHDGAHSLKTTVAAYTSGDAKWYFTPQPVTPGQAYTFKDFYESDVHSRVVVQFGKKDGSLLYKELQSAPASSDWKQYQASFTAPTDAKTMTVFHLLSAAGYLTTDDYQVTDFVPEGFKRGLVSITWDDGVESQYTKAFPLHKKYNLPGSFFLISGDLDKDFYMTTAQAKEVQSAGNELGSHTVTHPHLPSLKPNAIEKELRQSQSDLRTKFGTSFQDFVTPYGEYNDQVMTVIKKYYKAHRSVEVGYNAKNTFDIDDIVVQNVYTTTSPSQVESWVEKAKTDKTWLVLVYHQVDNPGDEYSVSSSNLDTEFNSIKNSGLQAKTVNQALEELLPQLQVK
jgi:peptidoglycan/xylan/chitin deacetylase (PgdA/CDA1 family)